MDHLEDRLRRALHEAGDRITPKPRWDEVAGRAVGRARWRPGRVLVPALAAAIVLAIIGVVVVIDGDRVEPADGPTEIIGYVPSSEEYEAVGPNEPTRNVVTVRFADDATVEQVDAVKAALSEDPDVASGFGAQFFELPTDGGLQVHPANEAALERVRGRYSQYSGVARVDTSRPTGYLLWLELPPYGGSFWCEESTIVDGDRSCGRVGGIGQAAIRGPANDDGDRHEFSMSIYMGNGAVLDDHTRSTHGEEIIPADDDEKYDWYRVDTVNVNEASAALETFPAEASWTLTWEPRSGVVVSVFTSLVDGPDELLAFARDLSEVPLGSGDDLPVLLTEPDLDWETVMVVGNVIDGEACLWNTSSPVNCAEANSLTVLSEAGVAFGVAPLDAVEVELTVERDGAIETVRTPVLGADLGLESGFFAEVLGPGARVLDLEAVFPETEGGPIEEITLYLPPGVSPDDGDPYLDDLFDVAVGPYRLNAWCERVAGEGCTSIVGFASARFLANPDEAPEIRVPGDPRSEAYEVHVRLAPPGHRLWNEFEYTEVGEPDGTIDIRGAEGRSWHRGPRVEWSPSPGLLVSVVGAPGDLEAAIALARSLEPHRYAVPGRLPVQIAEIGDVLVVVGSWVAEHAPAGARDEEACIALRTPGLGHRGSRCGYASELDHWTGDDLPDGPPGLVVGTAPVDATRVELRVMLPDGTEETHTAAVRGREMGFTSGFFVTTLEPGVRILDLEVAE